MIPCQRHLFDIPDEVAYFNCAYLAPLMQRVRAAGHAGVDRKSQPWQIGPEDFFAESEQARALFAALIGASADDVAIIPAVSYGMAVAAALVDIRAGDEIVVLQDQFPSNYYPWLEVARAKQASMITVKRPEDMDWTSALLQATNKHTAVVACPHVHWIDGSLIDLVRVGQKCRQVGAVLALDATQSVGALPISVHQVQPGFLVAAAYKWLLGPFSLGFMYVNPAYQEGRPLEHNWLNRKGSEDFAGLVNYCDDFQSGARRFDVGERSNFALMPMAVAALQQVLAWEVPRIQETLSHMTMDLSIRARELGLGVIPSEKRAGHILGLRFPKALPDGLLQRLSAEKVYISLRGNAMRISPHLYNNEKDMDRLMTVLAESL